MENQMSVDDCISEAVRMFCDLYASDYPWCQTVKEGLKRLLRDRYRNVVYSFTDNFVHPTVSLLSNLQEKNFPLHLPNGDIVLHLVPPPHKLNLGEFFYQVGHTTPGTLVAKFSKYRNQGKSVMPLQRALVNNADHDIAFTKEYFDNLRRVAEPWGDVLMRTLIVFRGPEWSIHREPALQHLGNCPEHRHGRLTSEAHLAIQESGDDDSSTSESLQPNTPSEHSDFSTADDVFSEVLTDHSD